MGIPNDYRASKPLKKVELEPFRGFHEGNVMKELKCILYFAEGVSEPTLAALMKSEAASVVSDLSAAEFNDRVARDVMPTGPGDKPGVLFAVTPPDTLCEMFGFFPDSQEWTQTSGSVWVGVPNGAVIRPEHLLRFNAVNIQTERVKLADRSVWECPILRQPCFDHEEFGRVYDPCLLYTSPSPRD